MDLYQLSLTEAAGLLARRELSSEELTQACLARVQSHDPQINAFITLTADLALDQAREADRFAQGDVLIGPLHGIPIALKDLFETKGVRTTAGSRLLSHNIPAEDCRVYQSLRSAGSVLLGKLNMHEWAFGVTNQNPHYGSVHNPWDLNRISGGSSGGSAAALSAGLCFGALGTDTGGSIRIPASLCGVVGLKPTFGRVSMEGVLPLSVSLDHAGPMGRTVADAALLYSVISGHEPERLQPAGGAVIGRFMEALNLESLDRFTVARASNPYFNEVDAPVAEAVMTSAAVLESLGAEVAEIDLPGVEEALAANVTILLAEAAAYHAGNVRNRPQEYSEDVLERLRTGLEIAPDQVAEARRVQSTLRGQFVQAFEGFDALLTPSTPIAAIPIQGSDPLRAAPQYTRFTAPFNLTGLPALSIPCGFTPDGLPIGLQLVGPSGSEWHLLAAGHAYEQAAPWNRRPPIG